MGGALAAFIKNAGVANAVAETVVQFSIPGIIIPILIAALIHVITGSNALGVMTAAALVEPMLGALGISPLAAFLACGTGALMFKHANSSGFWVTVTMSNMDIRQGIRAVGGGSTVAGVTGAAITVILHFAGIIVNQRAGPAASPRRPEPPMRHARTHGMGKAGTHQNRPRLSPS